MNLLAGIIRWEIEVCRKKLVALDTRLAQIVSLHRVLGGGIVGQDKVRLLSSQRSRTAGILDRLGEELRLIDGESPDTTVVNGGMARLAGRAGMDGSEEDHE